MRGARRLLLGFATSVLLSLGAATCAPATDDNAVFLATDADFQNYRSWQRFDLGVSDAAGHSAGQRYVYLNRPLPAGATHFPVGTILIKALENDPDPTNWELFAMVHRGQGFNPDGLAGWEFVLLKFDATGTLTIEGRGVTPVGTDGYGATPDGMNMSGCNGCHGTLVAQARDGLLSTQVYNATLGAH